MNVDNELRKLMELASTDPLKNGVDMRMDLSFVIVTELKSRGWSQKKLAETVSMEPAQLNRLIHGSYNWTTELAGRVLFGLGLRPRLTTEQIGPHVPMQPLNNVAPRLSFAQTVEYRTLKGKAESRKWTSVN